MSPSPADPTPTAPVQNRQHTRYGLILFALYLALYVGFMALAAFAPQMMAQPMPGGINVAIAYGIGLIFAAFILALFFNWLCRDRPSN